MRIDLSYGTIDAYKLKISSKNILINSSGDNDPLFVVRTVNNGECKNLMYVEDGGSEFFFQSGDYSAETKKGMKIDVMHGSIESYNFSLRGEATGSTYGGSYILMTSGTGDGTSDAKPVLQFHLKTGEKEIDLLKISPDEFVLNSPSFDRDNKTGLSLDLQNGIIESYDFSLRGESDAGYIYITSNDEVNNEPLIELSSKVNNSDVRLLAVSPRNFELKSSQFDSGTGIYLDVYSGNMEVKNNNISLLSINNSNDTRSFTLTSPDFNNESGASGINLDILNGYFEVKKQDNSLMAISDSSFTLTSNNFADENGATGMQIDVLNGSIKVRHSQNLTLLHISPSEDEFFLKSQDWMDDSQGMQINLIDKKIIAYKSETQKLIIDANTNSEYPLQIGTSHSDGKLRFRVDWNGVIHLDDSSFEINNDMELGGGTFSQSNIRASKVDGEGGNITAEGWIRAYGGLYGNSINIKNSNNEINVVDSSGNLTVRSINVKNSDGNVVASISADGVLTVASMGSSGGSGGVTDMGAISASTISATGKIESNANIKGDTVTSTNKLTAGSIQSNGAVTVKGNISTTDGGTIAANGALSGASISTTGTLTVGGVTTFKKEIKFGPIDNTSASGTQNYYFTINPPSTLTGDLSVRCQKLDVKTVAATDGTEIQVLVVPADITSAWVLY